MTNFKPEKSRSAEDWQELAVERVDSGDSNLGVGGAIIVGLVLGAIASPLTGMLAGALILYRSFRKTHSVNSAEEAIRDYGCVAAFLDGNNLKDYAQQVGLPECVNQIRWAIDRGHSPSSDAQALMPKQSLTAAPAAERVNALAGSATNAVNRLRGEITSLIPQPPKPNDLDLIGAMSDRVRNHLIIGAQGSGKGLIVSNALDAVKAKYPNTTIFYIDPKGDEKETGYFTGRVDILKRTKALEQKPSAVIEWFKSAIKEFQLTPGEKLLILDEATYLSSLMKNAGEGNWFKSVIMSLVSIGDSQGWNIWIVALNPNTDDIGVSGGVRSQFMPLALITAESLATYTALIGTKWLPSDRKLLSVDIQDLCKESPVNRCYYYGQFNNWFPLPTLTNYSGYDRDARAKLEGCLDNVQTELQSTADFQSLTPNAQSLLQYFQRTGKTSAVIQEVQPNFKVKGQRFSSEELKRLFNELVENSLSVWLDANTIEITLNQTDRQNGQT
ncbi:hypothetical protein [Nostoc sp. WHI]|uniref:hypothetical protein n=1 Tax=Nostoc sp. WHI TaxID=2650611 RepID=UPI0018C4E12B|nr:hypothetical protein [Nostoc sp. WHI]MBG1267753.1 hypothetical protein [Nostoc sp. WHI]